MANKVSKIPPGFHTITPQITVRGADKALDFYKKAFGAEELMRMKGPDGKVMHGEIKLGDSIVFVSDEFPEWNCRGPASLGGVSGSMFIYVEDADAAFAKAVAAGATALMPVSDMFWGDRMGKIADPFGQQWSFATHKEDLTPEQISKRQAEFFAKQKK